MTVNKDGSPQVVPIWFVVENGKGRGKVGNIILTTGNTSVKANNIQHDDRVSICIDDQKPPFSFITIHGTAKIYPYKQKEVLKTYHIRLSSITSYYTLKQNITFLKATH